MTPATKNISRIQVLVSYFSFPNPTHKGKNGDRLSSRRGTGLQNWTPKHQQQKQTNKQTQKEDLKAPSEYYQQQQTQWKKEGGGRTRTRRIISFFGLWFSLFFFVFSSITFPFGVGAFFS